MNVVSDMHPVLQYLQLERTGVLDAFEGCKHSSSSGSDSLGLHCQ
jgi:hypothetical protein